MSGQPVFDILVSADALVDDADETLGRFDRAIGLPAPRPSWSQEPEGHGFRAWWCRVHPKLQVGPTRLEIIAPKPVEPEERDPAYSCIPEIWESQRERPVRTHSTVFATRRFEDVLEHVRRAGITHRVDEAVDELPFPRLWIGRSREDPATYDAEADGGMYLEVLPLDGLNLPEGATAYNVPPEPEYDGAELVRIVSRGFLVDDLDATLRRLADVFRWEPDAAGVVEEDGCRTARMAVGVPHSATLQISQPLVAGDEAAFMARWGAGPYDIKMAVGDVDAKEEDLQRRGTPYRRVEGDRGPQLRVDPAALGGTRVVLVGTRA